MARIIITDRHHFFRVARAARQAGLYPALAEQLHLLQSFGTGDPRHKACVVRLMPDSQSLSCDFQFFDQHGTLLIAGGLIFHPGAGPCDSNEAVLIAGAGGPGWRLHS